MQSSIRKSRVSHQQELFIYTCAYVSEVKALLTISGISKSCKVELNLTGSGQYVRSEQSCFHYDDKILMRNTL